MDLKDYSTQAMTFAKYPRTGENVAYPALGLISEVYEFVLNPSVSEAGDCLWQFNALSYETANGNPVYTKIFNYHMDRAEVSNASRDVEAEFGQFLNDLAENKEDYALKVFLMVQAFPVIGKLADIAGKAVRKHDGRIQGEYRTKMADLLPGIANLIELMSNDYLNALPEELAEANIEKLSGRAAAGTIVGNGNGISGEERKAG